MTGVRLVVRVSSVGVDRDDRWIVSQKILAGERFHKPLLNFMFPGAAVANAGADFLERCRHNGIDAVASREV